MTPDFNPKYVGLELYNTKTNVLKSSRTQLILDSQLEMNFSIWLIDYVKLTIINMKSFWRDFISFSLKPNDNESYFTKQGMSQNY